MKKLLLLLFVSSLTIMAGAQNVVRIVQGESSSVTEFNSELVDSITIRPVGFYGIKLLDNMQFMHTGDYAGISLTIKVVSNDTVKNAVELWNVCPFFAENGFVGQNGYNILRGTATVTDEGYLLSFPPNQTMGYEDCIFVAYDAAAGVLDWNKNIEYLLTKDLRYLKSAGFAVHSKQYDYYYSNYWNIVLENANAKGAANYASKRQLKLLPQTKQERSNEAELKDNTKKVLPLAGSKREVAPLK